MNLNQNNHYSSHIHRMDETQTPSTSPVTPTPQPEAAQPHGGMGPMIGIAIILGLMIVGGVYFYGMQLQQQALQEELPLILGDEPEPAPTPTDDVSAIEADIGADMNALEAEIEADLDALEGAL